MIIYRDDHWPPVPLEPRGPTPDKVPTPDAPSPGGGAEDPGFPGGGGAGGAYDHPDYPEQPDPDFDDDRYYDGGAEDRRDDGFRMRPLGNRCMQARHELSEAYDQLADDERAIENVRERLAEDTAALGGCGSSTARYFVYERGEIREISCDERFQRRIASSERLIEMHQARQRRTRAQIPVLRNRVREYCVGP